MTVCLRRDESALARMDTVMPTLRPLLVITLLIFTALGCQVPRCFRHDGCLECARPPFEYREPCYGPPVHTELSDADALNALPRETAEVLPRETVVQAAEPVHPEVTRLPNTADSWRPSLEESIETALRRSTEIAVSSYTPPIFDEAIDAEFSTFDPVIGVGILGGKDDRQVPSFIDSFGGPLEQQLDSLNPDEELLEGQNLFLGQELYTGGRYWVGLSTEYDYLFPVGPGVGPGLPLLAVNPAWRSAINFRFEQPLFRGRGPEVATSGIAVARVNQTQSVHEFQEMVNRVIRDVRLAYWTVASSEMQVEVLTKVVTLAETTLERERGQMEIGRSAKPDVAEAEERYLRYRVNLAEEEKLLTDARVEFRRILGVAQHEYGELVIDSSEIGNVEIPDWEQGILEARNRPFLLATGSAIRAARINLAVNENGLEPDVAIRFDYAISGLEERFDDSLQTVGDNRFNLWEVGVTYRRYLGQRRERADFRQASLLLRQREAALVDAEHNVMARVHEAYQRIRNCREVVRLSRRRREVAESRVKDVNELYVRDRATLFDQLEAEERFAEAAQLEVEHLFNLRVAQISWLYETGLISQAYFPDRQATVVR